MMMMHKTRSRPKSGRKPLRDIQVYGKNVPVIDAPLKLKKNTAADSTVSGEGTMSMDGGGDGVLDRLLLVRSELQGVVREANAFRLVSIRVKGGSFLGVGLCLGNVRKVL